MIIFSLHLQYGGRHKISNIMFTFSYRARVCVYKDCNNITRRMDESLHERNVLYYSDKAMQREKVGKETQIWANLIKSEYI